MAIIQWAGLTHILHKSLIWSTTFTLSFAAS